MRKFELGTPGLKGLKPEVLQTPQPMSKPGKWETLVPRPCTKQCCISTEIVTELHEQVCCIRVISSIVI